MISLRSGETLTIKPGCDAAEIECILGGEPNWSLEIWEARALLI
jgi:hypothetical protein